METQEKKVSIMFANEDKHWHAIYVKSRSEKKVAERLDDLGIDYYLPLVTTIKQWSDRKKRVEEPLFKSYVNTGNGIWMPQTSLKSGISYIDLTERTVANAGKYISISRNSTTHQIEAAAYSNTSTDTTLNSIFGNSLTPATSVKIAEDQNGNAFVSAGYGIIGSIAASRKVISLTVTTGSDDKNAEGTTLRDAIKDALAQGGGEITIDSSVNEIILGTGEGTIQINASITIKGHEGLTIKAASGTEIFNVTGENTSFTINNVAFIGNGTSSVDAGLVAFNGKDLTLNNISVQGFTSSDKASAFYINNGIVSISNSKFMNNGSASTANNLFSVEAGTISISNSVFSNNLSDFYLSGSTSFSAVNSTFNETAETASILTLSGNSKAELINVTAVASGNSGSVTKLMQDAKAYAYNSILAGAAGITGAAYSLFTDSPELSEINVSNISGATVTEIFGNELNFNESTGTFTYTGNATSFMVQNGVLVGKDVDTGDIRFARTKALDGITWQWIDINGNAIENANSVEGIFTDQNGQSRVLQNTLAVTGASDLGNVYSDAYQFAIFQTIDSTNEHTWGEVGGFTFHFSDDTVEAKNLGWRTSALTPTQVAKVIVTANTTLVIDRNLTFEQLENNGTITIQEGIDLTIRNSQVHDSEFTNNGIVNVYGKVLLVSDNGTAPNWTNSNGSSVNYSGTTAQNIANASYYNLSLANSEKTALDDFRVTGTFTLENTASLVLKGANNSWNTQTATINGAVTYNSDNAQTVLSGTYVNLTFAGQGAKTFTAGDVTILNSFDAGNVDYSFTAPTEGTTTLTLAGELKNNTLHDFTNLNVVYSGDADQTVAAGTYTNLTFSGNGAKTFADGNSSLAGTFTTGTANITFGNGEFLLTGQFELGSANMNAANTVFTYHADVADQDVNILAIDYKQLVLEGVSNKVFLDGGSYANINVVVNAAYNQSITGNGATVKSVTVSGSNGTANINFNQLNAGSYNIETGATVNIVKAKIGGDNTVNGINAVAENGDILLYVVDSVFSNSHHAIYAGKNATITIERASISDNTTADTEGTAIYLTDGANVTLLNTTITRNAGNSTIYAADGTRLNLLMTTLAGNNSYAISSANHFQLYAVDTIIAYNYHIIDQLNYDLNLSANTTVNIYSSAIGIPSDSAKGSINIHEQSGSFYVMYATDIRNTSPNALGSRATTLFQDYESVNGYFLPSLAGPMSTNGTYAIELNTVGPQNEGKYLTIDRTGNQITAVGYTTKRDDTDVTVVYGELTQSAAKVITDQNSETLSSANNGVMGARNSTGRASGCKVTTLNDWLDDEDRQGDEGLTLRDAILNALVYHMTDIVFDIKGYSGPLYIHLKDTLTVQSSVTIHGVNSDGNIITLVFDQPDTPFITSVVNDQSTVEDLNLTIEDMTLTYTGTAVSNKSGAAIAYHGDSLTLKDVSINDFNMGKNAAAVLVDGTRNQAKVQFINTSFSNITNNQNFAVATHVAVLLTNGNQNTNDDSSDKGPKKLLGSAGPLFTAPGSDLDVNESSSNDINVFIPAPAFDKSGSAIGFFNAADKEKELWKDNSVSETTVLSVSGQDMAESDDIHAEHQYSMPLGMSSNAVSASFAEDDVKDESGESDDYEALLAQISLDDAATQILGKASTFFDTLDKELAKITL